jgi:membrane-associated phospholipid phosphatase
MTEIISKAKPYQHWFLLIPLALSGVWFSLLEQKVLTPEYLLHIRLDDYIPFTPLFVIPYALWYFYVAATAVFLFVRSPRDFARMAIFLALGMMIACTIYTLFPNGQALRPVLRGYEEPLVRLIRFIYASDTPANSAPSIHVVYSVAAHAAIARYNSRRQIPMVNGASFILAGLCILSTVFIKQHSVIDLTAGLLLSALLYFIIYRGKGIGVLYNNSKQQP